MYGHSDDWIENRIIWHLNRRCLSDPNTHLLRGITSSLPLDVALSACNGTVGIPVVYFHVNEEAWTLVGTNAIAFRNGLIQGCVELDNLQDASLLGAIYAPGEAAMFVEIRDKNQRTFRILASPGQAVLALCGVLLMLIGMQRHERGEIKDGST